MILKRCPLMLLDEIFEVDRSGSLELPHRGGSTEHSNTFLMGWKVCFIVNCRASLGLWAWYLHKSIYFKHFIFMSCILPVVSWQKIFMFCFHYQGKQGSHIVHSGCQGDLLSYEFYPAKLGKINHMRK